MKYLMILALIGSIGCTKKIELYCEEPIIKEKVDAGCNEEGELCSASLVKTEKCKEIDLNIMGVE